MASVVVWNLRWASPRSERSEDVLAQIGDPDLSILSEVTLGVLPSGHVIDAGEDWGYSAKAERRKVAMVSQHPWTDVEVFKSRPLGGRCLVGSTQLNGIGKVACVGVCIPWSACHVTSGQKDKARWEEHADFLHALGPVLTRLSQNYSRIMLGGDFNQRLPRKYAPIVIANALEGILSKWNVPTRNLIVEGHKAGCLNHFASLGMNANVERSWPGKIGGMALSDHAGVCAKV